MRWMAEVERRGEYCADDHGRAAPRRAQGVVCDVGEGARAARGGRGVDPLWMAAMSLVGGVVGPERALDARGLLRSCAFEVSRLEEMAGWSD